MNDWRYHSAQDLGLQTNERHCSPLRESDLTSNVLRLGWLDSRADDS